MICPYCFSDIHFAKKNSEFLCPACKEQIPRLYLEQYDKRLPFIPISVLGFSGHGKTVYIASLLYLLQNLGKAWPQFYRQGLDLDSISSVQQNLMNLASGHLPESTRLSMPRPSLHVLNGIPNIGKRTIALYDPPGEAFNNPEGIIRYASFVKASSSILLLISINDLQVFGNTSYMTRFLENYLWGIKKLNAESNKQQLIVVFTKADLLLDSLRNFPILANYVREDDQLSITDLRQYINNMQNISNNIERFTLNEIDGGISFNNLAKSNFRSVKYSMVSALGSQPHNGTLINSLTPKRVLDPLLWILNDTSGVAEPTLSFWERFLSKFWKASDEGISNKERLFQFNSIQDVIGFEDDYLRNEKDYKDQVDSFILVRLMEISRDIKLGLDAHDKMGRMQGLTNAINSLHLLRRYVVVGETLSTNLGDFVIKQWEVLFEDELSRIVATEKVEIENPYQAGNPIKPERHSLFKGRQELIRNLVGQLSSFYSPTFVLYGPRRMGKTSLLLNLPKLLPHDILPVYIDFQRPSATENLKSFLNSISHQIVVYARIYRQTDIPELKLTQSDISPFNSFENWIDNQALPCLKNTRILLCLDEFENLIRSIEEGRIDIRVLNEFRHIIQHQKEITLLFAGVNTLDDLGANWSNYFINVIPLQISYLREQDAKDLILNPDPGTPFSLTYPLEIVDKITRLSRCQPFLIQLLCSSIVDLANSHNTLTVTDEIFDEAMKKSLLSGEPYFRNIWDEATGKDDIEVYNGRELLLELANSTVQVNSYLDRNSSIDRLVKFQVIQEIDGLYEFQIPIMREWVRSYGRLSM